MTDQEIIQIVQTWLNNNFQKTKVSQLATASSLTGLYVLGFLANGSVKAPIELLKGNAGKSVELRNNDGELQWRVEGGTWAVLYEKAELQGEDGKPFEYEDFTQEQLDLLAESVGDGLEFSSNTTHIQYRLQGGTWEDIVALSELKGPKGDPGSPNTLSIGTVQSGATAGATITGTSPNQTLNLTLQKGDKGDPNTLSIGTVQGGANAGATISGTAPNQILNLTLPKGDTGSNIELQKTTTHVQWRVVGGSWANLIPLSDLKGEQGDSISLQKTATHIQWRLGTGAWTNLVPLTELKGDTGANIELQKSATHVQWRVQGTTTWNNLILIDDLKVKGDTGANIELQKSTTHVQWRVQGTTTWINLIPLSELKGEKGDAFTYSDFTPTQLADLKGAPGDEVSLQTTSTHIQWRLGTGSWTNLVALSELKGLKGDPGATIELQKTSTHVQWRVIGTSTWNNLIALEELKVKGDTGASVELQKTATYIQWRVVGSPTWTNLIALSELKVKGDPGENIELQKTSTHVQWRVVGGSWANLVALADLKGDQGQGLPTGGSTGQQLVKKSAANYDYEWQTPAGAGDMLKSVYDPSGKNTDVFGYVDNKVKTDVPVGAKFTDTTYTEIAEAEIDTGTASTLRTITARRITYILSKAQALINSAISALTKSSVGLGNVDNVKQASKTEFDTHDSDTTIHITSSERTAWNAKGSSNLALGETSATAYRGDRGKTAYDHSQTSHAPSNAQKNSDITKAEIEAKLTGAITSHTHNQYIESSKFQVVESLPASPAEGVFYFVKE